MGRRGVLLLLALLVLLVAWGAAATPGARAAVDLATVWQRTGCDGSYYRSPANGIDSTVMRVKDAAGSVVVVQWRADVAAPTGFTVDVVDMKCRTVASKAVATGEARGSFWVALPAGAEWLVIHHTGMVGFQSSA